VTAYTAAPWTAAFAAIAGSSAALTGLLFVAISINLSPIIKGPALVPRAIEVLVLLTAVLVLATLLLMPSMTPSALGVEVLTITLCAEVLVASIQVRSVRRLAGVVTPLNYALRVVGGQIGLILLLIGGVSLLTQSGGGLYWVVPGMAFAMVSAIIGAWVLLVEILR
jgi:modulator of FtsH protease